MQDIDFDELDRAVSSVLGTAGQSSPAPAVISEPIPVSVSTSTAYGSSPVVEQVPVQVVSQPVTPAPQPVVSATPINHASNIHVMPTVAPRVVNTPPAAPVTPTPINEPATARRSNGRFMDVVHSSSNMRPATAPTAVSAPEPIVDIVPPAQVEAPLNTPLVEDLNSYTIDEVETAPLETPFLTDAKVEKRPLGAFSPAEAQVDSEEELVVAPKPPVFEPSLEISEEVLIGAEETDTTDPLAANGLESSIVQEPAAASWSSSPAPQQTIPLGAASISQQYTEQAVAAEPSGSIFDTESYHQALAHPQKSKSGMYIILWVAGLGILGGALGFALYYFVLRTL